MERSKGEEENTPSFGGLFFRFILSASVSPGT